MADPEVEASFLILVLGPETEVLCLSHSSCREPQCVILVLKPLVPASVWGRGPALLWSLIRTGPLLVLPQLSGSTQPLPAPQLWPGLEPLGVVWRRGPWASGGGRG